MKFGLIAALGAAFLIAACTPEQRCRSGEAAYIAWKASGRGGEAEKKAIELGHNELRKRCAAQGIIIQ